MKKKFDYKKHIMPLFGDEIEVPMHDNFGEGLTFKTPDDKRDIVSKVSRDQEGYRELTLEITSLRGSIGAVHFYATIRDHSLSFCYPEDITRNSSVGGYATRNVPNKYSEGKIEVYRPVTDRDIKHDKHMYAKDYRTVRKGQKTKGFWTEQEAIDTGIQLFKAIYRGKWKLTIRYYSDKEDEVIKLDDLSN